jgi:diaminopimelate epimerase
MHGAGNDYVYVDASVERVDDPPSLARVISDRHFGVGSDGLILLCPSDVADVRMRMFNADGSEAEMCGNGIRCVAKYAHEHGLSDANPLRVETAAGVKTIDLHLDVRGRVSSATVDMGPPILAPAEVPVTVTTPLAVDVPLDVEGRSLLATCVSMGNPHAVIFVDDVEAVPLERWGAAIECDPLFPRRTNVHFVEVSSPAEAVVRQWERGSGATLACGTGAAAVCVAGVLTGRTARRVTTRLPGGELVLEWPDDSGAGVRMTGPAEEVFTGDWPG